MAKFITSQDANKYVSMLEKLADKKQCEYDMKRAIHPAAGFVAAAIERNIKALPVVNDSTRGTSSHPIDGVTQYQKRGLLDGFGIASFQERNGFLNVKLGFDGYNKTKGKSGYQPNVVIARSVESGTSFRKKHPFIAPAVRQSKATAETKMKNEMEKILIEKGF